MKRYKFYIFIDEFFPGPASEPSIEYANTEDPKAWAEKRMAGSVCISSIDWDEAKADEPRPEPQQTWCQYWDVW